MKKPVRGRFFLKLPLGTGGSFTVESDKDKSIEATKMVESLRHYADFIETHFLKGQPPASATAAKEPEGRCTPERGHFMRYGDKCCECGEMRVFTSGT